MNLIRQMRHAIFLTLLAGFPLAGLAQVKDATVVDLSSLPTAKFDEIIKKDPAHKPIYMLHRATVNMVQGKPLKALEDVDQVLKYKDEQLRMGACPGRNTILKLRITALHKLGRFSEAYADCNTVLKTQPTDEQARLAKAMGAFQLGKYKEVIEDAGKIKADPGLLAEAKTLSSKATQKLSAPKVKTGAR